MESIMDRTNMKKIVNNQPLVSVVMPVYNAGSFLVETLNSLLGQTYQKWHLLAVDDYSTDNSWEILKRFAKKDKCTCGYSRD